MLDADVVIIGAGVAGSSVATLLADAGARVVVLEKDEFPRHKLCGEFLSYEVRECLTGMGVAEVLRGKGARSISRARLTSGSSVCFETPLPDAAIGISRYALDMALAERAESGGAAVRFREPVKSISGSLADGFVVRTASEGVTCTVVVGAYGRHNSLDRSLNRDLVPGRTKMAAFKAHFEGVDLGDVIELHSFAGGYCGMSHVEGGLINVCWLTTSEALLRAGGSPEDMMRSSFATNEFLADRMGQLEMISKGFQSVAGLAFTARPTWADDVMMVGDSAGMISPLCGDGMGMAVATATIAAPMLCGFLNGDLSPRELRTRYSTEWSNSFGTRMRFGASLNRLATNPHTSSGVLKMLNRAPAVGRWLIHKTRS